MSLSRTGWSASEVTIQPSRHPVIAQDFEKLFMTMMRSAGSAMSSSERATGRS